MTVGTADGADGTLLQVTDEKESGEDEVEVALQPRQGKVFADLRLGADIAGSRSLRANSGVANRGVQLLASGFSVTSQELAQADPQKIVAKQYLNGRDITDSPRGVFVLDTYPLSESQLLQRAPAVFQWLHDRAKPERDHNPRASYRENWWLPGENQPLMRRAISDLQRFVVTAITARHRTFVFVPDTILPDQALLVIGSDTADVLGTLSSRLHIAWALAAGGRLGVGNDPRYNKTRCFETFPFPDATAAQQTRIGELAEQLDAHRKRQQAAHAGLTLTGMYNVLEKLRAGEALSAKDKIIHEQGLVSVLRELHDALDTAVFEAYGWADLAPALVGRPGATTPLPEKPAEQAAAEEELLTRLVALNAERAAEEARGQIRWLRPDYQNPGAQGAAPDAGGQDDLAIAGTAGTAAVAEAPAGKQAWPKSMREQVAAVRAALAAGPLSHEAIAARFKRRPAAPVLAVLDALEALGMVSREGADWRL